MKFKKALSIILIGIMVVTSGCGKKSTSKYDNESSNATILEETTTVSAKTGIEEESNTENSIPQNENRVAAYEGTPYTWEEFTVTIPDAWKGKYLVDEFNDGFAFIQKSSHDKRDDMGFLCAFSRETGPILAGIEVTQIAYTGEEMYYMSLPSDVSYCYEDKEIDKEYKEMCKYMIAMAESLVIEDKNIKYDPDEYVIPMSDTYLLQKEDLSGLNINDLWVARNEIFARHGMGFKSGYLQAYFNSCSWYEPGKQIDQFNEADLNDVEVKNLTLIKEAEKAYNESHPYPKKEKVGEEITVDLNQDGVDEKVLYEVENVTIDGDYPYEENNCYLTINGTKYDLSDYGMCPETPDIEYFYITDIAPYQPGLEIALLDYGPSADEETIFGTYDGDLHAIGTVEGFPMKDLSWEDGFANENNVQGVMRVDVIESCYGYVDHWYNVALNKLEVMDNEYHVMIPEEAKKLYVDLPVYTEMDTTTPKKMIPAQDEVYFVGTDAKEWVKVRGKDGSKGYMHVVNYKIDGLDIDLSEVFSNLAAFG